MSRTSNALRRAGVGLLSAATIGSGLVAFALPASAAASTSIKAVTLTPASTALSTEAVYSHNGGTGADGGCQLFTVDAVDSTGAHVTSDINVILTPSSTVDSQFCYDSTTSENVVSNGGSATGNVGQADQAVFTGTGPFYIGVNEPAGTSNSATPAGTIGVQAYADVSGDNVRQTSESAASSTVAIIASPTNSVNQGQDEITNTLKASPTSATGTQNSGSEDFTVTATNGSALVAGADVYYVVTSSQGNVVDSGSCSSVTDNGDANEGATDGQTDCSISNPATLTLQTSPYTVTLYTPHPSCDAGATTFVSGCDASTTVTLNEVPNAPNGSAVYLNCGTAATNHYAPYYCEDTGGTRSETLTATVLRPATVTGAPTLPVSGVEVNFVVEDYDANGGSSDTVTESCITDSSGSCNGTVTRAADDQGSGAWVELYAWITTDSGTVDSDSDPGTDEYTDVDWGYYNFTSPATNIKPKNASDTAATGATKLVEFDLSNQYDNPANATCLADDELDYYYVVNGYDCDSGAYDYGTNSGGASSEVIPVTLTVTGGGSFSDGTTTKTINAANGLVQVAVTSSSAGTTTVTGSIDPATTDCSVPASSSSATSSENDYYEYDPTARAGNCTASEAIVFSSQSDTLAVSAGNGRVNRVENASATVKKADGSADAGVVVHFTVTGANSASGSAVTNSSGVASFAYTPRHAGSDTVAAYADATGTPHSSITVSIAKAKEHPSISLSSTTGHVTVHVTSHPRLADATVTYYVKRHGSFHKIGENTTGSGGKAHKTFTAKKGAKRTYKAKVSGNADVASGKSKAKSIRVKD